MSQGSNKRRVEKKWRRREGGRAGGRGGVRQNRKKRGGKTERKGWHSGINEMKERERKGGRRGAIQRE